MIVGNCIFENAPAQGYGFLYSLSQGFIRTVQFDAFSTTLYGIWQNNGINSTHYTIVGGAAYFGDNSSVAFMVNYKASHNIFMNFKVFAYEGNDQIPTHFEGISAYKDGFTLAATEIICVGIIPLQV